MGNSLKEEIRLSLLELEIGRLQTLIWKVIKEIEPEDIHLKHNEKLLKEKYNIQFNINRRDI